jgi:hypothetical protein
MTAWRKAFIIFLGVIALSLLVLIILCIVLYTVPPGSKITDDYRLVRGSWQGTYIGATSTDPGVTTVVCPEVIDLDWNEEFIVVKQIVSDNEQIPFQSPGTYWYVIEVENHRPFGPKPAPLSYNEYLELRESLSVPQDLDFLKLDQEPWTAYKARRKKGK